jgi:uncharacterized protein
MAISLYDVSVRSFLQVVGSVETILARGLAHAHDNAIDPQSLVAARLTHDMLPLAFQVNSVAHHSIRAIEGCKAGVFGVPGAVGEPTYADLQKIVSDAKAALEALTADEVNALEGQPVVFRMPNFEMPFKAEAFLMSFSLPNLHFHATTAYDILRAGGTPLGKRDYLGAMRVGA